MGFFKKIRRAVKKVVRSAPRIITGVATGGTSELLRATGGGSISKTIEKVLAPTSLKGAIKVAALVAAPATGGLSLLSSPVAFPLSQPQPALGDPNMGLGNVLGGLQGVLGTVSQFGGPVGQVAQIGSGFLSGFLPAQGPKFSSPMMQPQMTMAAAPVFSGAAQAITGFVAPILARMSVSLGKNITLRAAMIIVRRLGKVLTSPAAVAAAVGLSLSELSQLLTANALAGSSGRRMNAGNVKALRRAHRRIKSFHKLCGENDRLKAPRRRSSPKVINVKGALCN